MNQNAENTGRYVLALDVADARVGLALGTFDPPIAVPLTTLERAAGRAERRILEIVHEKGIQVVVAGLPLDARGARTAQCERVERFCGRLQRRAPIEIIFQDEYLSSLEADELLVQTGQRRKHQEGQRQDALAAASLLQAYLDERKR